MNYSKEHTFNKKALDYKINRILQENEEKHKKIHDDLIRDINTLKGKLLDKENIIKELNRELSDYREENNILSDANSGLKESVQMLRKQVKKDD